MESPSRFSVWRSLKLGSFNFGSALVDILTASVWNRLMIVDLGWFPIRHAADLRPTSHALHLAGPRVDAAGSSAPAT